MSELGGGVYYTFSLQDNVSPALTSMNIKKQETITNFRVLGDTAKKTEHSFRDFSKGCSVLSSALVQVSIMSFVLNLTQRRLSHAHETLRTATENLEKAELKHGDASLEAERASRKLKLAQEDLTRANFEATIQIGLFAAQGVLLTVKFIDAAKRLSEFTGVTKVMTVATLKLGEAHTFSVTMTEASTISTLKNTIANTAATVVGWGRAAALWAQAHAVNILTFGTAALAAATAYYIYQAGQATQKTRELQKVVGEAPSSGLVKGFEDLTASMGEFNFSIRGISIFPTLEKSFEAEWTSLGTRIKGEMRRHLH